MSAESESGPLQVQPLPGWEVKYDKEHQFYALTRQPLDGFVVLTFSRDRFGLFNQEKIPEFLDSMAKGFQDQMKSLPELKSFSQNYAKGAFSGDTVSGEFIVFTMADELMQAVFMFSDGEETWQGQYTGSCERWAEAVKMLKDIKKSS